MLLFVKQQIYYLLWKRKTSVNEALVLNALPRNAFGLRSGRFTGLDSTHSDGREKERKED